MANRFYHLDVALKGLTVHSGTAATWDTTTNLYYIYTDSGRTTLATVYDSGGSTLSNPITPATGGIVDCYLDDGADYYGRAGSHDFIIHAPNLMNAGTVTNPGVRFPNHDDGGAIGFYKPTVRTLALTQNGLPSFGVNDAGALVVSSTASDYDTASGSRGTVIIKSNAFLRAWDAAGTHTTIRMIGTNSSDHVVIGGETNPKVVRISSKTGVLTTGAPNFALELGTDDSQTPNLRFQGYTGRIYFGGTGASDYGPSLSAGSGSPENVVTANVGSLYLRTDGGALTSIYVKESGTGNTGWAAK